MCTEHKHTLIHKQNKNMIRGTGWLYYIDCEMLLNNLSCRLDTKVNTHKSSCCLYYAHTTPSYMPLVKLRLAISILRWNIFVETRRPLFEDDAFGWGRSSVGLGGVGGGKWIPETSPCHADPLLWLMLLLYIMDSSLHTQFASSSPRVFRIDDETLPW